MGTKESLIAFVAKEVKLWEAGKIKAPVHFCGGNESQLIEIFKEVQDGDYIFSSHRNTYHALLCKCNPDDLLAEILGGKTGRCLGRARSMGFIDCSRNFYSSAIVGGCCAIAVGVAWALKEKRSSKKVWCFVGDGALDGGHFWEAWQYACGHALPLTFVVENNNRATCTSIKDRCGFSDYEACGPKMRHYKYTPTYPHVGTGKYIAF